MPLMVLTTLACPEPPEAQPGNAVSKVWEQEHKRQQQAYKHPDDPPEQGGIQKLLNDFVIVVELLDFHILCYLVGFILLVSEVVDAVDSLTSSSSKSIRTEGV